MRQAREWGYQRLAAAKAVVIIDAAPPPVARVIDGGCASTLAFEMSDGPHRLIVTCGGARAAVEPLPPDPAEGLRTTAADSTLVLAASHPRSEERLVGTKVVSERRSRGLPSLK